LASTSAKSSDRALPEKKTGKYGYERYAYLDSGKKTVIRFVFILTGRYKGHLCHGQKAVEKL
jgi:hypothetical protein